MAEFMEMRAEDMIPLLELLEKSQLFDKKEIKVIAQKKKDFEYKMARVTKCKEDTLRYIQYEMDLLLLLKQKRLEKGFPTKKEEVDYLIANHVNHLFNLAIRRFSDDVTIWFSYIKFCKSVRFYSCGSKILDQFISRHGDKPDLFVFAAEYEFRNCGSVDKARKYILTGLHLHKDSEEIYKASFRLELDHAAQKRKEYLSQSKDVKKESKNEEESQITDPVLCGKLAEVIYEMSIKKVNEADFGIELMKIASEFDFTEKLQAKIIDDLVSKFPNSEKIWDMLAKRELEKKQLSLRNRITNCCQIYESAIEQVPTSDMVMMYVQKMYELKNEGHENHNKMIKNCFVRALLFAHNKRKLTEKFYLIWFEQIQNNDLKLPSFLQSATDALPHSWKLWYRRIMFYMKQSDDKNGLLVFNEALKAFQGKEDETLPLWKYILQYYQLIDSTKLEALYQQGLKSSPSIAKALKPLYLQWVTLNRGIVAGRKLYEELAISNHLSLELHQKMIYLEEMQPKIDVQLIRKCHLRAVTQCGENSTEIWMNYIMFEQKLGDPLKTPSIYEKAISTLNFSLVDIFNSEYNLMKSGSLPPVRKSPENDENETPEHMDEEE